MCTVTYVPINPCEFVFTSNRDEKIQRIASPPRTVEINGSEVFFPVDNKAGGSWIASNDKGRVCCLLNGENDRQDNLKQYKHSRGLLIIESFKYDSIHDFFTDCDLTNIQAFTMIVVETNPLMRVYEFRWEKQQKYLTEHNATKAQIWSSTNLYSEKTRKRKEDWFNIWMSKIKQPITPRHILQFHSLHNGHDLKLDVIIKREQDIQTVSVTQICVSPKFVSMQYNDLCKDEKIKIVKDLNFSLCTSGLQ